MTIYDERLIQAVKKCRSVPDFAKLRDRWDITNDDIFHIYKILNHRAAEQPELEPWK